MNEQNNKKNSDGIKKWIINNKIIAAYFLFSVFIEVITVFVVENNPVISNPLISLGILLLMCGINLLIKNNTVRFIVCSVLLVIQAILDLGFAVLYDMTGQYFDFGMLNLRNDAFGILESIPMNFIVFYAAVFCCIFFVIFAMRSVKRFKKVEYSKLESLIYVLVIVAGISLTSITVYANNSQKVDKYDKLLNNKQGSNYSSYGIIGNVINEFSKGFIFNKTAKMDSEFIDDFIYKEVSKPTVNFGVCKDKNMIVILVESFEWFSFIKNDEYPNGLDLSEEDYRYLFPNLTKFYDESVVVNNFHSKEKTDISETISIMGSYPTDSYVDYDYEENVMPQTVPNILKLETDGDIVNMSFHNGFKSFYNREKTHASFGFEKLLDSYDMYDISDELVKSGKVSDVTMHDYMNEGERNLDSEMVNTCKDYMFSKDKRFFTYITTITMHGMYYERDNLKKHMDKFNEVYKAKDKNDKMEAILMNYVTTVMEFDDALGIMMKDLEDKGILDNTTILMFGDHNSYYQQLSNYVKDIEDYDTENYYPDLYKVPLMIYDKDLGHQVIDKFTCTSDIVPTLLDLAGINYYSNMYYGHSVFDERESVMYSRAYGIFVGEGIVGRSINSILYKAPTVKKEYVNYFNDEAKNVVEKIKYCDQIFYWDYFADENNYNRFVEKMREIN